MTKQDMLEGYFSALVRVGFHSSKESLRFYLQNIYKDISFDNKRVLDVGGGTGAHSFYAACMGAKEVICLEPMYAGSTPGATKTFFELQSDLGLDQVKLEITTFQKYKPESEYFDVLILHNSINHLDEQACMNLHLDQNAREVYRAIFHKLAKLANTGAKLIVCDCSRHNFFALLNMRNPFAPSIEWHKHHEPEYWAKLLAEYGFDNPLIRWLSPNTLGVPGKLLFGNKLMAYFLGSHFCLKMEKT